MRKVNLIKLLPIAEHLSENREFEAEPNCQPALQMTVDFYQKVGFQPPWIGYFVELNNKLVGAAAFKGRPINNKIEIAYGVFADYMNQGIGTGICRMLTELALETDPKLIITARTLPENNYSTKILQKNGFKFSGTVFDEEDGNVWEWVYQK